MYWFVVSLACTSLIPAAVGLYRFKVLKSHHRAFVSLLVLACVTELSLFIVASQGNHNLFIIHIWSIVQIGFLTVFFSGEMRDFKAKRSMQIASVVVILFSICYATIGNNINLYPSIPRAAQAIVIMIATGYLFYEIAITVDRKDPLMDLSFYAIGGVMMYFTGTFVTWCMMKYVITDLQVAYALSAANVYVNAFCNLIFTYGLWKHSPSLSYRSSRSI